MKQLISISFKYICRQKMRTFLTFMCVVLSAFILAAVCFYGSSFFTTMYNYNVAEEGLWELEISSWISSDKQLETAKNHAVVDDYLYSSEKTICINTDSNADTDRIECFEISDEKSSLRTQMLSSAKNDGNSELSVRAAGSFNYGVQNEDGAAVPYFLKEAGYSVGDTVTLTIRPFTAVYDNNSELIKEIRDKIEKKKSKNKQYSGTIRSELGIRGINIDDYPLAGIEYGEPVEITVKIAGFVPKGSHGDFISYGSTDISFKELVEKNPKLDCFDYYENSSFYVRLTDSCDFDEAVKMLFTDLGYDYKDFLDYKPEANDLLLALEVKSPDAMFKVIIIIVPVTIIILIAWFISRFVIDNTFEMAVKERSTHFAELRVIGASKDQIAAIVLTEALFYCLTAVPLGMVLAFLLCRMTFLSISQSGLEMFEFSAYPLFVVLSAFLSVSAVFISAYTSAMWAARKLSPAEALNFGKPARRRRRKIRQEGRNKNLQSVSLRNPVKQKSGSKHRVSKLDLSFNRFLLKYTRKNIMAVKSRFVISTVTMALGILMFTVSALTLISFRMIWSKLSEAVTVSDFEIKDFNVPDTEYFQTATESLRNKDLFSEFRAEGHEMIMFDKDVFSDPEGAVSLYSLSLSGNVYGELLFVNEGQYKFYELDTITGMSYREFSEKKTSFYNQSIYGTDKEIEFGEGLSLEPVVKYDKEYKSVGNNVALKLSENEILNISGIVRTKYWNHPNVFFISAENADEFINANTYFNLYLTVNGQEHYDEALECAKDFKSITGTELFNNYRYSTGINQLVKAVVKAVLIFLASIWLVGILSMINSVNTSVLNRSSELMMLRSLGMTEKQLRRSVLLETVMFSSAAAISGTAVGTWLFCSVSNLLSTIYSERATGIAGPVIAVIAVTLVINVLIALLSALPAIRALGRVENIARTE